MQKRQWSIRLSGEARSKLGRDVLRLTINPVLLSLARPFVDLEGHSNTPDRLHVSELALKARERFPKLRLSWAVEGYIALLLTREPARLLPFAVEPYDELDESVRRFLALSPARKIRVGQRWARELRQLRRAT